MVGPLFDCVVNMLPEASKTQEYLKTNKEFWEGKIDYYEDEMIKL